MFRLKFGLLMFFAGLICLVAFGVDGIIFSLLFGLPGIYYAYVGISEIKRNKQTEKKGEICYGAIEKLDVTGASSDGKQEYKAVVNVYVGSVNKVCTCSEIIGFDIDISKYSDGSCVKVKYYNGDINFIEANVNFETIPLEAQDALRKYVFEEGVSKYINAVKVYRDDNIIEVDGVKYKKID